MTTEEKIPVLAVVGPTASGKTGLGVMLAQQYRGEVVSADSMQIYEELDIATAKPTPEEQQGIPHHLIGCVPMEQSFSVADYLSLAKPVIREVYDRRHLPVVVGGTGLYISSLLSNVQRIFWAKPNRGTTPKAGSGTSGRIAGLCQRKWKRGASRQAETVGSGSGGRDSPQ